MSEQELLEKRHRKTCSMWGRHRPSVRKTHDTMESHKTRFASTSSSMEGSEALRNSGSRMCLQICLALRACDLAQRNLLRHHCCGQGPGLEADPVEPLPRERRHGWMPWARISRAVVPESMRPRLQSDRPFPSICLFGPDTKLRGLADTRSVVCRSEVEGLGLELEFESGVCQTPELVLFVLWNLWRPEKLSPRVSSVVEVASEMSLAMWGGGVSF